MLGLFNFLSFGNRITSFGKTLYEHETFVT
jgi:hypothetical protein